MSQQPPSETEVFGAFSKVKDADPACYDHLALQDFFLGYLIGKGWDAAEAIKFVNDNPIEDGRR